MLICGIDSIAPFQGDSYADWISGKVFDYDFVSCMDKEVKELDDDLK